MISQFSNDCEQNLILTFRAIAAIENPADVYVISSRQYGQRAVLKTARYIGATPIASLQTYFSLEFFKSIFGF